MTHLWSGWGFWGPEETRNIKSWHYELYYTLAIETHDLDLINIVLKVFSKKDFETMCVCVYLAFVLSHIQLRKILRISHREIHHVYEVSAHVDHCRNKQTKTSHEQQSHLLWQYTQSEETRHEHTRAHTRSDSILQECFICLFNTFVCVLCACGCVLAVLYGCRGYGMPQSSVIRTRPQYHETGNVRGGSQTTWSNQLGKPSGYSATHTHTPVSRQPPAGVLKL